MIEFYAQIKMAHVFFALCSGALFALRGAGVLADMRWPHWAPLRWTSYAIDTCLLTAALMLLTILPGAMFANGWLATKLVLLVVYIVLGVFALRRGRTRAARAGFFVAALAVFGFIVSVAVTANPYGALTWLG